MKRFANLKNSPIFIFPLNRKKFIMYENNDEELAKVHFVWFSYFRENITKLQ